IEYTYSLPSRLKLKFENGYYVRKYILRRIGERFLPEQIVQQPKRGFPLPLGIWLKGALQEWARELLHSLCNRGYFEEANLQAYITEYFEGPSSSLKDHIIWAFVALELFLQAFSG